jgi:hypothetical protein
MALEIDDLLFTDDVFDGNLSDLLETASMYFNTVADTNQSHQPIVSSSSASDATDPDFIAADHSSSSAQSRRKPARCDPNRNAKMAKANREKHKEYVASLEARVETLAAQASALTAAKQSAESRLSDALLEVQRLRATLDNQSAIANAIQKIQHGMSIAFGTGNTSCNTTGSAFANNKHGADHNEDDGMLKRARVSSGATTVTVPIQLHLQLPM